MIEFDGVWKRYAGRAAAGPISLSIPKGEFVALLGRSGSGKTTTLKMINGLVTPDSGTVRVDGDILGTKPLFELRRRIGYVFQEVGLFSHLSVAENIAVGPKLAHWEGLRIEMRVKELLILVGLDIDMASRYPAALSGGQRQRVGVARALAAGPGIMLMDEPFGALDPMTRDTLGRDYRNLHERLGLTTVMVTHDVMEALQLADRIVVLDAGRVVADGTPAHLLSGHDDPAVQALMETPRRQARRLDALLADAGRG